MFPRRRWGALSYVLLMAATGCGARTTLGGEDGEPIAGGSGSGGEPAVAGTSSGGSGPGGAPSGRGGTQGVGSGGPSPGGSPGAGTGGSMSAGGMGTGVGQLKQACDSLCAAYVDTCPGDFSSASECSTACLSDARSTPSACRPSLEEALLCVALSLPTPASGCEARLEFALAVCEGFLEALDRCTSGLGPKPTPGPCASVSSEGEIDCSIAIICEYATYSVACSQTGPSESTCVCTENGGSSGFTLSTPISCDSAFEYCGFEL